MSPTALCAGGSGVRGPRRTVSPPRRLPALVLSLTALLVIHLVLASSAPGAAAADIHQLRVTAVQATAAGTGACRNDFPAALNCTLPVYFIALIDGFPANGTEGFPGQQGGQYTLYLQVVAADGSTLISSQLSLAPSSNSTSTVSGAFRLSDYAPSLFTGALQGVAMYDSNTQFRTAVTPRLVSLAPLPTPALTAISGCRDQPGEQATLLCVPDRSVLTLTGTGFSTLQALGSFQLIVGAASSWLWSGGSLVRNGSRVVLSLAEYYATLDIDYSGAPQPIALSAGSNWGTASAFTTNALTVSFAPLPPPTAAISSASNGCTKATNGSLWQHCLPGISVLTFKGHYLSSCNISLSAPGLGSYACPTPGYSLATQATCTLPIIAAGRVGQLWDVEVRNPSGAVTLRDAVRFTTAPALALLSTCTRAVSGSYLSNCWPGQTLTISGSNFPLDSPAVVVNITEQPRFYWNPITVTATCLQPRVVDSRTITCVAPTLSDPQQAFLLYGRTVRLQVDFPGTGQATNVLLPTLLLAYPDSPVITSVTGCAASLSPLSLLGCRVGDELTVRGERLWIGDTSAQLSNPAPLYSAYMDYGRCTPLPGSTNATVRCQLPQLDREKLFLDEGAQLVLQWWQYGGDYQVSWAKYANLTTLQLTFEPPTPNTNGAGSGRAVPLAAVVAPIAAFPLALLCAALLGL